MGRLLPLTEAELPPRLCQALESGMTEMEKFERVLLRSTILIATQGEHENDRQPRHGAEAGARRGIRDNS